jgi:hypothetical protein
MPFIQPPVIGVNVDSSISNTRKKMEQFKLTIYSDYV